MIRNLWSYENIILGTQEGVHIIHGIQAVHDWVIGCFIVQYLS